MVHDDPAAREAAAALAEIDTRRRQAIELSDPLPTWAVLATMLFVAGGFALQDVPAGPAKAPLGYAVAVLPLAIAALRWRLRRATAHPSLRWQGWWIVGLGLLIAIVAVWLLPSYVAKGGVPYPATVAGVATAGVIGPLMVLVDRLRRRYIINHAPRQ